MAYNCCALNLSLRKKNTSFDNRTFTPSQKILGEIKRIIPLQNNSQQDETLRMERWKIGNRQQRGRRDARWTDPSSCALQGSQSRGRCQDHRRQQHRMNFRIENRTAS